MFGGLVDQEHSCGSRLSYGMKFCPGCGEHVFKVLRSEGEIKAMRTQVSQMIVDRQNDTGEEMIFVLLRVAVGIALEWTLGGATSPVDLLKTMKEGKNGIRTDPS